MNFRKMQVGSRGMGRKSLSLLKTALICVTVATVSTRFAAPALASDPCSRQSLASQILARSDKITLRPSHSTGRPSDAAYAILNIQDTANGGPAMRSSYLDTIDRTGPGPGGTTWLDAQMLDIMLKLAVTYNYSFTVTEIAGGAHELNSPHYSGKAFDVGTINGVAVSANNPAQAFRSLCGTLGASEVLGPGSPDGKHETHVHVGWLDLPAPNLIYPANTALGIPTTPTLKWDALTTGDMNGNVTGATLGYKIAIATSPGVLPTDPRDQCLSCIDISSGNTSYLVPSALSAGTTYYWKVRGRGAGLIYGNWSCTYSFTTQLGFSVVTVNSPNGGEIWGPGVAHTISWSVTGDTSPINNFLVSYSIDGGSTYGNNAGTATATSRSILWTPPLMISLAAIGKVRVQARDPSNSVLAQDFSDGTFAFGDTTPPGNVGSFNAVPGNGQITLSWSNPIDSDYAGVQITRKTGGYPTSYTDGAIVYTGTGTSTTDRGLANGTTYFYKAFSYDTAMNYSAGATANATPQPPADTTPPTPNPSTWATVPIAADSSSINMTATTASDSSGVQYYFHCLTSGGHDSAWQASATYADTGLSPNTAYSYQVKTRDQSPNQNQGDYSTQRSATTLPLADTAPPTPNPITWTTEPYAVGTASISMTATTASDLNGVQYFFHCLTTGGHDSSWQASATYVDTGLSPNTTYDYQVKARDQSPNQNQGGYSIQRSATTPQVADTTPPTPNPSTWATEPYGRSTTSISMTATTASDPNGVQYFFHCSTSGGHDSLWQASATYEDTGLSPNTKYFYEVTTRDQSANQNQGTHSTPLSATTPPSADTAAPSVAITLPTMISTYSTSTGTISLGGTASDNVAVFNVTWSNPKTGGGGTASGTTVWTASNISLAVGANAISVKAYDAAGNHSTAVLTVTYTPVSTAVISLSGDMALGATQIGSAVQNLLAIQNVGTVPLNVTSLICPTGFSGSWSGSIAPGGLGYALITFEPILPARYGGAIVVTSDAGSGTNTIPVSGVGISTDPVQNPPIALGARLQRGSGLVITWPTTAAFQLEYATNPGPSAVWRQVEGVPSVLNGQNVFTNSLIGRVMFFRLHK